MFTVDGIRQFHRWTHASLSLVLDHVSTMGASDYAKELPGFASSTVRQQVMHVFNCEGFWIHLLRGLPFQDRTVANCPTARDARLLQQEVSRETLTYLSSLSDERLNAGAQLHFPDGDVAIRTPALILHHVFTHAFHHKGQIVAMCRALGHPAPDTDLNQFE